MKAVIFAGGVGTRLWPLSRKKSPKQFEKIIGDKSTLQLSIEVLLPEFKPEDIYIATSKEYIKLVANQLPFIPNENILGEPCRKDLGAAVALWMGYFAKKFPNEPIIVLWADHNIRNKSKFKKILKSTDKFLISDPKKIIYFGHVPRFPSTNLGWIETGQVIGEVDGIKFHTFEGFKYRPDEETANRYFEDAKYCWNIGSFATTPAFIYDLFKRFTPKIYRLTEQILNTKTQEEFYEAKDKYYSEMPELQLDHALSEQLDNEFAHVLIEDIGWSDIGAWEALKEALEEKREENIIKGKVMLENSLDNLVYNYQNQKMIIGIDLNELLVVNTDDVLLVANKNSVGKIKKLVESFQGTEFEDLT